MMMLTLSYSVMTRELGQSTMMLPPFLLHNTLSRIKQFGMQATMARVEVMVATMVVIVEVEAMTVVVVMTAVVVVMAAVAATVAAAAVAVVTEHAMLIC